MQGACTIVASQAGNGSFSAAPPITQSFSVTSPVSLAGKFSCALNRFGTAVCWGINSAGQLGNGTTTNSATVGLVTGLSSGVIDVSARNGHACALTTNGAVQCWGSNTYGQLGNGTTTNPNVPTQVTGLTTGVTAIGTGANHSCAVTSAGAAQCWGLNNTGQLGNGTTTKSSTPVQVTGLTTGVVGIGGGNNSHTCVLTSTGGVQCWGNNTNGQLGNGTTTQSNTPVPVTGLSSGVVAIAVGGTHNCALTNTGFVQCWGGNTTGQLGDGTTTQANTPVQVTGLSSVVAITAGGGSSCALTSAGAALCWGDNSSGQLGNGAFSGTSNFPLQVSGLASGVVAIAEAASHGCAMTSAGVVQCWGTNTAGELGDGTQANSGIPVTVAGFNFFQLLQQTITFGAAPTVTVGGTGTATATGGATGNAVTFSSTTTDICTVSGNTVSGVSAGTCTIAADQAGNTTYSSAPTVTQSFTVLNTSYGSNVSVAPTDVTTGKQVATITFSSVTNPGQTTVTSGITAPATPTLQATCSPTFALDVTTTAVFSGDATVCVTPSQLGSTCAANASLWHHNGSAWDQLPAPANTPAGQICGITTSFSPFAVFAPLMPQTITFGGAPTVKVGGTGMVTATGGASPNPVILSSQTPSICTVAGSTVMGVSAGICTIAANQAGDVSYAPALEATQSFQVTPALIVQTISFPSLPNQVLGTAPFAVGATASSGLTVSLASLTTSTCSVSGSTVTLLAVGTCTLQASQAGNGTYTLATPVSQSFSITASGGGAGGDTGDVPLPAWALALLGSALLGGIANRKRRLN
jgi:alpha-tubulin suppressor-like RCC1 family protein